MIFRFETQSNSFENYALQLFDLQMFFVDIFGELTYSDT